MAIKNGNFLISEIKQLQDRIFEKMLKSNGIQDLNGPQGRILSVLWEEDNLSISELSNRTSLAKTSLTSMLDRLVERDYLNRVYDDLDKRQIRIILTQKAKSLRRNYESVSSDMQGLTYSGMAEAEIEKFEDTLGKIIERLKAY